MPAYAQIADRLRSLIRSGVLAPGEQLPTESQLIEEYGVARMTVRQALSVLREEGLVSPEHGRGVFVRSATPLAHLTDEQLLAEVKRRGLRRC